MTLIEFSDNPMNESLLYHEAISAYSDKQYYVAIEYFKKLVEFKESIFHEACQLLLILCYLYTHQNALADEILDEIKRNPLHKFSENAKQILKRNL